MDSEPNVEEPSSWDELYNINLMPSELFLKFRKEVQGVRVALNMEVFLLFSLFVSTFEFMFALVCSGCM